jgi:predicted amidohydrolase
MEALELIRTRVRWCEAEGVTILCCPEAILGGLADYAAHPNHIAISADAGELDAVLAPLASDTVTTIIGFTELASGGRLHNSAAVFQHGAVLRGRVDRGVGDRGVGDRGAVHGGRGAGLYRKLYPAIRKAVYEAGCETPVFQVGELTFGILICNDSNYSGPARLMAARGATALFVPTNNGLPPDRAHAELVAEARKVDIARAVENSMWVIRADVAGRTAELVSYGSSGIVDPNGKVMRTARQMSEDLIVAEIATSPRDATGRAVAPGRERP